MSPQVSIVMPTYNRAQYLPEALDSALSQTYPNIEVVVVNDGSTDNTEEVLAPYMKNIHYIKQENAGCAAAKNTGLAASTGAFITNLDDDDRYHPEKVARQVEMFMEYPEIGICATGANLIDETGRVIDHRDTPKVRSNPHKMHRGTQTLNLLRGCSLTQPSVMIRRECHERLGNYKLLLAEDYDFWLRVSIYYEIGLIPDYLTDYRQHANQITSPQNLDNLVEGVSTVIQEFLTEFSLEQILPGICSEPEGHAVIGMLLCEQELFLLAKDYFERALPSPAAAFGLGLLGIHVKDFAWAEPYLEQAKAAASPFTSKVDEALVLSERLKTILKTPGMDNLSPEVVELRKDFANFRTEVLRLMLRLAKGIQTV